MSRLISAQADLEVVGVASDLPQLLAVIEEHAPEVVVTDIRMPPTGTDEGIRVLRVVVLGEHDDTRAGVTPAQLFGRFDPLPRTAEGGERPDFEGW